jgi:hypothetical protein
MFLESVARINTAAPGSPGKLAQRSGARIVWQLTLM